MNDPLLAYLPPSERVRAPRAVTVKASELVREQRAESEAAEAVAAPVVGPVPRAAPRFVPAAVQSRKVAQQVTQGAQTAAVPSSGGLKVELAPTVEDE